ncbi:MAG: BA14K family protein [Pseudomonadota bacterium]
MTSKNPIFKSIALALAASFVSATAIPVSTASAHDRHNVYAHHGHGTPLTRKGHKRFHKVYGPGDYGRQAYQSQYYGHHHHHKRKRKKRDRGDLVAAGVIGLAVGAIIASEASKRRHAQPSYQYHDPYRGSHSGGYHGGQHIPLNEYNGQTYHDPNEPNVITYNDDVSLEPWTPGWQNWCRNRYRSFNAQTGTYRGYDGKDHFCVPR